MLKIALLGYGKMGKAIEQIALKRGHEIPFIIDLHNAEDIHKIEKARVDVVIEFTHPDSFRQNMEQLIPTAVPIVTGTTGWHNDKSMYKGLVKEHEAAFMYASNFSVGVNLLFLLNEQLAKWMNAYSDYDVFIEERHHNQKADGPSGTAISLANGIIEHLDRKQQWQSEKLASRPPVEEELSIGFVRGGNIPGTHTVSYTSEIDSLSISHIAHNRTGFALGAVIAAEWIHDKKGFFEFKELFS